MQDHRAYTGIISTTSCINAEKLISRLQDSCFMYPATQQTWQLLHAAAASKSVSFADNDLSLLSITHCGPSSLTATERTVCMAVTVTR